MDQARLPPDLFAGSRVTISPARSLTNTFRFCRISSRSDDGTLSRETPMSITRPSSPIGDHGGHDPVGSHLFANFQYPNPRPSETAIISATMTTINAVTSIYFGSMSNTGCAFSMALRYSPELSDPSKKTSLTYFLCKLWVLLKQPRRRGRRSRRRKALSVRARAPRYMAIPACGSDLQAASTRPWASAWFKSLQPR
ncbi:hypothetical protein ABIG06_000569 [Bradyrhizobium sp. USDA 326]